MVLGDRAALMAAYPSARSQVLNSYRQDSICGTWELLADAIYPGGIAKFKKNCPAYIEVGPYKCEWARKIGAHMDSSGNLSPGFQHFIAEIDKRLPTG